MHFESCSVSRAPCALLLIRITANYYCVSPLCVAHFMPGHNQQAGVEDSMLPTPELKQEDTQQEEQGSRPAAAFTSRPVMEGPHNPTVFQQLGKDKHTAFLEYN